MVCADIPASVRLGNLNGMWERVQKTGLGTTASVETIKVWSVRDTSVRTKVCHRETASTVRLLAADTRTRAGNDE